MREAPQREALEERGRLRENPVEEFVSQSVVGGLDKATDALAW